MYLILNSENKILNISRMARYVYRQPNGIVVLCGAEKAEAIYSDDSNAFYPIERAGFVADSHTLVQVDSVPDEVVAGYYYYRNGEFYTSDRELDKLSKSPEKVKETVDAQGGIIDDLLVTILEA